MDFAQLAMRQIFHGIEVFIVRGNFDSAALTARTIKHLGSGIRDVRAINVERVIVKALVLGIGIADPIAIVAFGNGITDATDMELHALRIGRTKTGTNAPLRIPDTGSPGR
jgi:hypothetical protein